MTKKFLTKNFSFSNHLQRKRRSKKVFFLLKNKRSFFCDLRLILTNLIHGRPKPKFLIFDGNARFFKVSFLDKVKLFFLKTLQSQWFFWGLDVSLNYYFWFFTLFYFYFGTDHESIEELFMAWDVSTFVCLTIYHALSIFLNFLFFWLF